MRHAPPDIMTVDVEEWFHGHNYLTHVPPERWDEQEQRVERNTERTLELLDCAGVKATFFVLGWTAERHPDLIRRIAAAGHEIACHSHRHPVVHHLDAAGFRQDTELALEALARAGVDRVRGYRAPSFTITPAVHEFWYILAELGFTYDCSLFPVHHPRYGQPTCPRHPFLLEGTGGAGSEPLLVLPMTTARVLGVNLPFAGGAYLRLLPRWAYRLLRRTAQRQGQAVVTYFHPWELDDIRPDTGQGRLMRLVSQGGQATTAAKLEAILAGGRFATMGEYAADLRARGELPVRALPLC